MLAPLCGGQYHAECFSGFADPRSQAASSHHVGRLAGTQLQAAPTAKAASKMRTAAHFDHSVPSAKPPSTGGARGRGRGRARGGAGTSSRRARDAGSGAHAPQDRMSGAAGKIAGFGTNSFGARSAKGRGAHPAPAAARGDGLTEARLREHTRRMAALDAKEGEGSTSRK